MKKVAIIGSVGIPAKYGGFETLVEYLSLSIKEEFACTVYCSSKSYPIKQPTHNGATLKYIPLKANGFQSIPYDIWSIMKAIRKHDTLLILGVAGCFTIPFFKLFFKRRFVVHVDGIEWKRGKWGRLAKWYLKTSERLAAKRADVIIADNQFIKEYMDSTYGINAVMIPYGADHVSNINLSKETIDTFPFLDQSYAFTVCRIEPENNIHIILDCYEKTNKTLVIVGNWQYSSYGKQLYNKYNSINHIHLLDPIYDQNLLNQMRSNCSLYLHGHSAGGTNPSLVEAMTLGRNILAFDVPYNRATTNDQAIFFSNSKMLYSQISTGQISNGDVLKSIAKQKYTWETIANSYREIL